LGPHVLLSSEVFSVVYFKVLRNFYAGVTRLYGFCPNNLLVFHQTQRLLVEDILKRRDLGKFRQRCLLWILNQSPERQKLFRLLQISILKALNLIVRILSVLKTLNQEIFRLD
jgi:hypothetical protein